MATLIIAEKNKAAKAIAEAIGITKLIKNHNASNVYFIPSKDIYVLPLRGHILSYKNALADSKTYDILISPLVVSGNITIRLYEYENSKARKMNRFQEIDKLRFPLYALENFIKVFQTGFLTEFLKNRNPNKKL